MDSDGTAPVEEAIAAPLLVADRRGIRYEKGTRLADMAAGFKALGHANVAESTLPLKTNGLARDGKGGWRAAADARSEGSALALP